MKRGVSIGAASVAALKIISAVASSVVDWIPGVGDAVSASDALADYQRGNYGQAAIGAGLTALGVVPGVGDVAAKGVKTVAEKVAARAGENVLPAAEREANLIKFLEQSAEKRRMYHATYNDFDEFDRNWSTNVRPRSMDTVGSWFTDNPGKGGADLYASGEGASIMPVFLNVKNLKEYPTFNHFLRDMHEAEGRSLDDQTVKGLGSAEGLREKLKDAGYDGLRFPQNNWLELKADEAELAEAVARANEEYRHESRRLRGLGIEMTSKDGKPFQAKIDRLVDALTQKRKELADVSPEWAEQSAIVVFEPTQVKSATGNEGTFDPTKKDITKARGGLVGDPITTYDPSRVDQIMNSINTPRNYASGGSVLAYDPGRVDAILNQFRGAVV